MSAQPQVRRAVILQIMPAPGPLADKDGNIVAGYALCEFEMWCEDSGEFELRRDILPFGTDGGIDCRQAVLYYELHALGDDRPSFAEFVSLPDSRFA